LLSATGETQTAVFTITDTDSECEKVEISWKCDSLIGIEHLGVMHDPTETLELVNILPRLVFRLTFVFQAENHIEFRYHATVKSGEDSSLVRHFDLKRVEIPLTLYERNEHFQQIQIANVLPVSFTFEFEGKVHTMHPNQPYYILRKTSEDPIRLLLREEGWEEYPVALCLHLKTNEIVLQIDLNCDNWIVGEGRVATLAQPATVLPDSGGDWLVGEADVDRTKYLLIPRSIGRLRLPRFIMGNQVVECSIEAVVVKVFNLPKVIIL
jgi:hypothetical protein